MKSVFRLSVFVAVSLALFSSARAQSSVKAEWLDLLEAKKTGWEAALTHSETATEPDAKYKKDGVQLSLRTCTFSAKHAVYQAEVINPYSERLDLAFMTAVSAPEKGGLIWGHFKVIAQPGQTIVNMDTRAVRLPIDSSKANGIREAIRHARNCLVFPLAIRQGYEVFGFGADSTSPTASVPVVRVPKLPAF